MQALVSERQRLLRGLQAQCPSWSPTRPQANFVLSLVKGQCTPRRSGTRLAEKHGIMIRHYAKPELSCYIRISVGRPEHTDALLAALQNYAVT